MKELTPASLETAVTAETTAKEADSLDISMDTSIIAEFTEKKADNEYADTQVVVSTVYDLGATDTRRLTLFKDKPVRIDDIEETSSEYAIIDLDEDLTVYPRTSDKIEDNGEFIISELESRYSGYSWFTQPVRVLKNELIRRLNKAASSINNQVDKSEDIGVFINILTDLSVVALKHKVKNLKARVGFPIPPKERYSSSDRLEEIKKTLAGVYSIKMPRFNFECTVVIDATDITIEAEGEVAFIFYTTTGKNAKEKYEEYRDKLVVTQDLGGSTFNIGLIRDGKIQSTASHTAKIGGGNIVSKLYSILSKKFKEPVSFERVEEAVKTGNLRLGAKQVPIGPELTKAKSEVAEHLFNENVAFLRNATLHGSDVYSYLFLGRGMLSTGAIVDGVETPDYSPSMAVLLMNKYMKLSDSTKSIILQRPGFANLLGTAALMKRTWSL